MAARRRPKRAEGGSSEGRLNWSAFVERVAEGLSAHELLTTGRRWVLGVSGGPDSTLMLHTFCELNDRLALSWALHVAHLHHGLRAAEADRDADFVEGLAQRFGLAFHKGEVDIRAQVAAEGGSTEEVARQHRYEFLERVALKAGSDSVAVAHHADDDAETVLHRICRGTGLRGLAGMREIRPIQPGSRVRLVRPFLGERRETLEAFCRERGFEFRVDSTNVSLEFTRGRIRNVLLPMLRESLNPNISEALLRLAEQAHWLGTYLEDAAARIFDSLVVTENTRHIVLNTRALLSKQRLIQAEVVRRAISLVVGGEQEVGFGHIDAVLKLAADRASGKEIHLPGPVVARKVYDRLEFRQLADQPDALPALQPTWVVSPGVTPLPALGMELLAEDCAVDEGKIAELRGSDHPFEEWLDFERVQFPLVARGRREGDRFWPLGAPGAKNLGDFLSDEKVDPPARARTGILCDQLGPIWVMPLRIDERVKLRPTTRRALRLLLRPLTRQ